MAAGKNYIIMGPQASGKGTQADMLSEKLGIPHISTGNLLREMMATDSPIGRKLSGFMNSGMLVPDEIVNEALAERFKKPDAKEGFILDGYPRNLAQAELLNRQTKIAKCIIIEISDEEAVNRISFRLICTECKAGFNSMTLKPKKEGVCDKCGGKLAVRDDDRPDAVKKRLKQYHDLTEPLIKFYEKKGILARIDGEQPIKKVFDDILSELKL